MPKVAKRGPLSPEDASVNYAVSLYKRLRCRHGWRKDIFALLRQEYARFARQANASEFAVQSIWEYMQLVEVTSQYLSHKGSRHFSFWFHTLVRANFAGIMARMRLFPFDEREEESMRRAFERMGPSIERWIALEEARE